MHKLNGKPLTPRGRPSLRTPLSPQSPLSPWHTVIVVVSLLIAFTCFSADQGTTESTPNLRAALDRMDRSPDLAYVQTEIRGGRKQTTRFWWKLRNGIRWVRIDSESGNAVLPLVTRINDGASRFSIFPDFVIKETNPVHQPKSLSSYYFTAADADYLESAAPELTSFAGVTCLRFSRNETGPDLPDALRLPKAEGQRHDYVEASSGNWIGYELTDRNGDVQYALLLQHPSMEAIADNVFAIPTDRLPVKTVRSADQLAEAITAGMTGRLKQFNIEVPGRFQRVLLPTILISTVFLFVARFIAVRMRQMGKTENNS